MMERRRRWQMTQLKQIDDAIEKAEAFKADPRSMFENVYSYMPDTLKEEMDAAVAANFWQQTAGDIMMANMVTALNNALDLILQENKDCGATRGGHRKGRWSIQGDRWPL